MDSFELNKFGGALTGSLMVFLLIAWFADTLFHPHGHGKEPKNYYAAADAGGSGKAEKKEEPPVDMVALIAAATPEAGAKVFRKCSSCHKADKGGANGQGPGLYGVMGAAIAQVDGFKYSEALTGKSESWNWDNMNAFLTKPKEWAPGTRMNFAGLKKPTDRAAVMVYLNAQTDAPIAPPNAATQ